MAEVHRQTLRPDTKNAKDGKQVQNDDPRRLHVLEVPFWDYGTGPLQQTICLTGPLLGTPPVDEVRARVARTVEWCPKLAERVVDTRFRLRPPRWEPDPGFDLDDHFHHVRLNPGSSRDDFYAFLSRIIEVPFDLNRPLWNAYYTENVDGGSVLAIHMHHVIGDGLSAVDLFRTLSDQCPERDEVAETMRTSAARAAAARTEPPEPPQEATASGSGGSGPADKIKGMATTARNLLWPEQPPVWKERIGPRRTLTWASLPMSTIREIRSETGTTMPSVFTTLVSMSLEQLYPSLPDEFPVSLPMSVRHLYPQDNLLDMSSRQISTPLALPMHVQDPAERLVETNRRISSLKLERRSFLAMAEIAKLAPRPALLATTRRKMRSSNVITSPCPGPRERWTIDGVEIDDLVFFTALVPSNPLAFVSTAYADRLSLGMTADPDVIPTILDIPKALGASLEHLQAAVRRRSR